MDDHSRDDTFAVIERLAPADPRVRGIRLRAQLGLARGDHLRPAPRARRRRGDDGRRPAGSAGDARRAARRWRRGRAGRVGGAARSSRASAAHAGFAAIYYWIMRHVVGMKEMPARGADFFLIDRVGRSTRSAASTSATSACSRSITWLGFRQEYVEYDKQPRVAGRSGWTLARKIKLVVDSVTAFSDAPIRAVRLLGRRAAGRSRRLTGRVGLCRCERQPASSCSPRRWPASPASSSWRSASSASTCGGRSTKSRRRPALSDRALRPACIGRAVPSGALDAIRRSASRDGGRAASGRGHGSSAGRVLSSSGSLLYRFNTLGGAFGGFDNDHFLHFALRQAGRGRRAAAARLSRRRAAGRAAVADLRAVGAGAARLRRQPALGGAGSRSPASRSPRRSRSSRPHARAVAVGAGTAAAVGARCRRSCTATRRCWCSRWRACSSSPTRRRPSWPRVAAMSVWTAVAFLFRHDYAVYCGVGCARPSSLADPWRVARTRDAASRRLRARSTRAAAGAVALLGRSATPGSSPTCATALEMSRREAERTA